MILSPELIDKAKKIFPKETIVPSDEVIAQHELYNQFKSSFPNFPKPIFYIVMNELFGLAFEKDNKGDLGRKLKFDSSLIPEHLKPKPTQP